METILVLGATSVIAQAVCRTHAASGARFRLLGRDAGRLEIVAEDLRARGAQSAASVALDAGDFPKLREAIQAAFQSEGGVDILLAAQGMLPSQEDCEIKPERLAECFRVNTIEVMQAALVAAKGFERQGRGICVIVGSVAGDRGRRSNYIYGSTKAALETFCEGLRQRLEPRCSVLLVKPGLVDTPMTSGLGKSALFSSPEKVGGQIVSAIERRKPVAYVPGYWRWIMIVIRLLPRRLVKRLHA